MSDLVRFRQGPVVARDRKKLSREPAHPTLLEFESPTRSLISLAVPLSARIVAPMIAMLVLSTLAVTALVPIDIVVTAQGKLVAKAATLVVQPLDTSIIRSIDVREGESVKAGQVLARLDPTLAKADVAALQASVVSLSAEMDRLDAEATNKPYLASGSGPAEQLQNSMYAQRHAQLQAQRESYRQKISSLETQIAGNLSQANYYRQRLSIAANVEEMRRTLEKLEVGSRLNSLAAADNRLEMTRDMVNSQAAADTGKRDLDEMIAERDQAEQAWFAQISQNITDQGRKLSDAREALKKALLHDKLVELRAPEDSVVLSISKVSTGSVMQSGDQFFTLVPADSPLEAQVFVQGSDSGWPHVGDPVTIKFDTFPYTTYGFATGTVQLISADSFSPTDQSASQTVGDPGHGSPAAPTASSQPVTYRTTVSLDKIGLHNVPPNFRMMPGMPVTTDIKVGHRTVLVYMLGRIMPVFSEGMREP